MNIKRIAFQRCDQDKPMRFDQVLECDIEAPRGRGLQKHPHQLNNVKARYVKLVILEGTEEFASINRLQLQGASM